MRKLLLAAAAAAFVTCAGLAPAIAADTNTTSPWGGGPAVKGETTDDAAHPGKGVDHDKGHKGGKKSKKGSTTTTTPPPK